MNVIEFRLRQERPDVAPAWVTITPFIDGVDLRDLVRPVELPFAEEEGSPGLAGSYAGIGADADTRWPGRHYLDAPTDQWFEDGDTRVLACGGCGESGCWDLTARVEVDEDAVTWSGFRMGHRDWDLRALGPFQFDRKQYEDALRESALPGRAANT